jgi:hypothetical protein
MSARGWIVKRNCVVRACVWTLVSLLTVSFPATGVMHAAGRAQTTLTVVSAPVGASVYMDGKFRGKTPLSLHGVAAGDHRVKVAKDGYSARNRTVTVRSGQAASMRINLTPKGETPIRAAQRSTRKNENSGSKKLLYIGAGAAAAGAVAYLAVKGGNKPPTVTGISVDPANVVGISSVTEFRFTAQDATDPDGDPLTITWDFGDGTSATGENVSHVYASEGSFSVTATVSDGKNEATATSSVTVRSLSGTWRITVEGTTTLNLTQSGTNLSGRIIFGSAYDTLSGTVSQPRRVVFRLAYYGWTFAGNVDDSGNQISGNVTAGAASARFVMTR